MRLVMTAPTCTSIEPACDETGHAVRAGDLRIVETADGHGVLDGDDTEARPHVFADGVDDRTGDWRCSNRPAGCSPLSMSTASTPPARHETTRAAARTLCIHRRCSRRRLHDGSRATPEVTPMLACSCPRGKPTTQVNPSVHVYPSLSSDAPSGPVSVEQRAALDTMIRRGTLRRRGNGPLGLVWFTCAPSPQLLPRSVNRHGVVIDRDQWRRRVAPVRTSVGRSPT